jgi:N-succinyldiaminopimelate aminotransferase
LSYSSGAPFQPAIAHALLKEEGFVDALRAELVVKRDRLCAALAELDMDVVVPQGTYFVTTDVSRYGHADGHSFCLALAREAGVVAIPEQVFYDDADAGRHLVRWAFCKEESVLEEGIRRLLTADLRA